MFNLIQANKSSFGSTVKENEAKKVLYSSFAAIKLKPLLKDTISFRGLEKTELPAEPIDPKLEVFNELVKKLKADPQNKKIKQLLLDKEKEILDQELRYPEKYIKRAFETNGINSLYTKIPDNEKDLITQIQLNALVGLCSYYGSLDCYGYIPKYDADFYYPIFEEIIKKKPDDSFLANELKGQVMINSSYMYEFMTPENKEKYEALANYLIEHTTIDEVKQAAQWFLRVVNDKNNHNVKNTQELYYEKWCNKSLPMEERKAALEVMGILCAPQLEQIVPAILKSPKSDKIPDLRLIAIWAAGMVPTEKTLGMITDIISSRLINNSSQLDNNEQEFFEIALSSLAEHKDINAKLVTRLLKKVKEHCPQFKLLADELLYIVKLKEYQKDSLIDKEFTTKKERDSFKSVRNEFVRGLEYLNNNPKYLNYIDKALLPMKKFISLIYNYISPGIILLNDTITSQNNDLIGKRTGDGRFWDMVDGASGSKAIIGLITLNDPTNNVIAHEFGHVILNILKNIDTEEYSKLQKIFDTQKEDGRFFHAYASLNILEYFAVGYELYTQIHKPHIFMLDGRLEGISGQTRFVLQRKDPKLYDFIEHIIKKYGQTKLNS